MATLTKLPNPITDQAASDAVKTGLPYHEAECVASLLGVSLAKFADLAGIPSSTFFRRKSGRFNENESDHIIRFYRLFQIAVEVNGDEQAAREWLTEPAHGLNGQVPLQVATTEAGARMVELLLRRIQHNIAQ